MILNSVLIISLDSSLLSLHYFNLPHRMPEELSMGFDLYDLL